MRAKEFTINVPITINIPSDMIDSDTDVSVSDKTDMMIPPLQQQTELLKKAAGVDSVYTDDQEEPSEEPDQIQALMHLAGRGPVG
jgi:hypothetical protein